MRRTNTAVESGRRAKVPGWIIGWLIPWILVILLLGAIEVYSHSKSIARHLTSWHTSSRIVVFESDDWGRPGWSPTGLRELATDLEMQSFLVPLTYESKLERLRYALESEDDLERLYAILEKHTDARGRHPVITANVIVTRPDYDAIRASDFQRYVYIDQSSDLIAKWKEGIERGVFFPQLHGREHINFKWWLMDLRSGAPFVRKSFELQIIPHPSFVAGQQHVYYSVYVDMSVLPSRKLDYDEQKQIVDDGMATFERIFGYKSEGTIAPFYMWDDTTEQCWFAEGIRYIQGGSEQIIGQDVHGEFERIHHVLGEKNRFGQVYLVRNCDFEPRGRKERGWHDTLVEIERAFQRGYPAILNTHSINYVSGIDPEMRELDLAELDMLLTQIEKTYPDVIYLTSVELGEVIEDGSFHDFMTGEEVKLHSPWLGSYGWIFRYPEVQLVLASSLFITLVATFGLLIWKRCYYG